MPRPKRIDVLQRLASHTEAENARRLGERLRALDTEERRLQQIRSYLAEYTLGNARASDAMTIGSLKSNRGFLGRLRDAVDQQRGAVESQRQQVEQQTRQWQAARARTRSLEKLGERQERDERDRQDRREQARLDEVATTRAGNPPKV